MKITCRTNTGFFLFAAIFIIFLPSALSIGAPQKQFVTKQRVPDLMVLVDARVANHNSVSLIWSKVINRADEQQYLSRLLTEAGWQASSVSFSDSSIEKSGAFPMSSVDFTSPLTIRPETGQLPIEPIIKTFRNTRLIQIVFMPPQGFLFQGVENYENKYVRILLRTSSSTYQYTITVKDPKFKELNLPTRKTEGTVPLAQDHGILRIAFVVVLALLIALLGYIITSRAAHRGRNGTHRRS